ncbi:uncharacterized protein LOC113360249 [Papaver somniferum]|uniref:uncharacterized protein LOC113360249 n=1 Tax=Papaver somniferum TaxID=3469 RepID=UPI000E7018FB|nr:uncharacterized protein LOC113360249 [Papaver somniferum]
MAITRKKPNGFFPNSQMFAMIVCLSVCAEMAIMASAWRNICIPGDVYIDLGSEYRNPVCKDCTNWCKEQCSNLGTSMVSERCKINGNTRRCKCCCKGPTPTPSPSTTRSPPVAPSPPLDPDDFTGPVPWEYDICMPGQTRRNIKRPNGKDCMNKPVCEEECKKEGRVVARVECVACCGDRWYNQCCCGDRIPSPPPPSPPPPPPSPPPPSSITTLLPSSTTDLDSSLFAATQ